MADPRYRVLIVSSDPVQYASANSREVARYPRFDLKVGLRPRTSNGPRAQNPPPGTRSSDLHPISR